MAKNFKTMPKGMIIVPVHNNPARCSVYDPVADKYVKGAINVTRQNAEMQGAGLHPSNWQDVAKKHGWGPLPHSDATAAAAAETIGATTNSGSDPAGLNNE